MSPSAMTVYGNELRIGDTIAVWWAGGRDTITALKPYIGPRVDIFAPAGAQIATFAINHGGMTIENRLTYEVFGRLGEGR